MFNGKTHFEWPFSIAMLNYQRDPKGRSQIWDDPRYCIFWIAYQVVTRLWHMGKVVRCRKPEDVSWCLPMFPISGRVASFVALWWYAFRSSRKLTSNSRLLALLWCGSSAHSSWMRRPLTVPIIISELLFELRLILWLRHASICLLDQLNFIEFYVVSLFQSLKSYHYLSSHLPSVSQYP